MNSLKYINLDTAIAKARQERSDYIVEMSSELFQGINQFFSTYRSAFKRSVEQRSEMLHA